MMKEFTYEVPIYEVKKVGVETKSEKVKCCDNCGTPSTIYIELEFVKGNPFESKPTGRESPCKMFNHYTTNSNKGLSICSQCHGVFCSKCIKTSRHIYDSANEETVGMLTLCEKCNKNISPCIDNILKLLEKLKKIESDSEELNSELLKAYGEMNDSR
jgi:hypothetical protein